jgi:hypothetical protein
MLWSINQNSQRGVPGFLAAGKEFVALIVEVICITGENDLVLVLG